MNLEFYLSLGISLFGGLGLGTLLATIVQLWFENRRFKIERKSLLSKEIYFKKIEAWERICIQMAIIHNEVAQYSAALLKGPVVLASLNISIEERIEKLSALEVWFSEDVRDVWNKIRDAYDIIYRTYLLAKEGKVISQDQGNSYVKAAKDFTDTLNLVKKKIREEIDVERKEIV
jgi:hypothetical protein